jgi:hypothetical protein
MDKFVNCVLVLIFNLFVSNRRKNFHKLKEWPKSVLKYPVGIKNNKVWPGVDLEILMSSMRSEKKLFDA